MKYLVDLRKISKVYELAQGTYPVLKNIDLKIKEGEFLAIVGPSGSGKTSLMNIIGLLDHSTAGEYFLEGEDVAGLNENRRAEIRNEKIGFVFQNFNLLPRTSAIGNVVLPLVYARHIPSEKRYSLGREMLTLLHMEKRVDFKPQELSGGQQQRVAIARALVLNPKIILADEPTGNLDTKTGREVMAIFKKLHNEGKTIIIITHSEEVAKNAQRIVKIIDGKLYS